MSEPRRQKNGWNNESDDVIMDFQLPPKPVPNGLIDAQPSTERKDSADVMPADMRKELAPQPHLLDSATQSLSLCDADMEELRASEFVPTTVTTTTTTAPAITKPVSLKDIPTGVVLDDYMNYRIELNPAELLSYFHKSRQQAKLEL